jgi:hypothetical protein
MYEELGGRDVAAVAARWYASPADDVVEFRQVCGPYFSPIPPNPTVGARIVAPHPGVTEHFLRHEYLQHDYRDRVAAIRCPTLLLGGELDPVVPIQLIEDMASRIQDARVVRFPTSRSPPGAREVGSNRVGARPHQDLTPRTRPPSADWSGAGVPRIKSFGGSCTSRARRHRRASRESGARLLAEEDPGQTPMLVDDLIVDRGRRTRGAAEGPQDVDAAGTCSRRRDRPQGVRPLPGTDPRPCAHHRGGVRPRSPCPASCPATAPCIRVAQRY